MFSEWYCSDEPNYLGRISAIVQVACLTNIHGRNGMVISSMLSMPKQRNRSFEFSMEKSFKILSFPAPSWSGLSGPSRNRSSGCKKVFNNAPRAFWIPAFAGMTGGQ
jgi:hypothetical protein